MSLIFKPVIKRSLSLKNKTKGVEKDYITNLIKIHGNCEYVITKGIDYGAFDDNKNSDYWFNKELEDYDNLLIAIENYLKRRKKLFKRLGY